MAIAVWNRADRLRLNKGENGVLAVAAQVRYGSTMQMASLPPIICLHSVSLEKPQLTRAPALCWKPHHAEPFEPGVWTLGFVVGPVVVSAAEAATAETRVAAISPAAH